LLPEGHTPRISIGCDGASRNSFTLWNHALRASVGWSNRGWAMWIVMYVAMIASLSAMGLAPSLVPLVADKDQLPHDEA
jgi:hypothetical protein